MLELPWLQLLEAIRPDSISMRVVLHELPRREGKCLAELYVSILEGAVTEPGKLLDPKVNLSPRQRSVVGVFAGAVAFSAKKDIYALSPSQALTLLQFANDVSLEIKNKGVVTLSPGAVTLKGVLKEGVLNFNAVDAFENLLHDVFVLGVERAFLIDKHLRVYNLEPAYLPSEVERILSVSTLQVEALKHESALEAYTQLARLGVDLSCLKALGQIPEPQVMLRALLTRQGELRMHLVDVLTLGTESEEVEIRAKGALEPVFWLPSGVAVARPTQLEEKARAYLLEQGAVPADKHQGFSARGQMALNWLSKLSHGEELPEWLTVDPDCLPSLVRLPEKPVLVLHSQNASQVSVSVRVGELKFSLDKLFEAASQNAEALLLEDDSVLTFSAESVRALKQLCESLEIERLEDEKAYAFSEIALLYHMLSGEVELEADEALIRRLMNFVPQVLPEDRLLPSSLKTTLRPYQHDALAWMSQMHRAGLGRLLADEMGLGKTLMVLSLVALIKDREGQKPSLVIAPTSVLDVWIAECGNHFQGLKAMKWHGAERGAQLEEIKHADLIVTSYALLRRDIDSLAKIPFRYLLLDEAQLIKNSKTESWKAARLIQADQRMALSGTPIENRISDLYSILELVSPSILGDERSFAKRYGSGERNAELRERLKPMILRRRKEDVESDLPPKIENILHCEMPPQQHSLYLNILKMARHELELASTNSIPLLAALTRLRQVCCDPRLLPEGGVGVPSAKLDLFLDTVEECLSSGRKIIIYSQFVKMQKILIEAMQARGFGDVLWLHGATLDRGEVVSRFQNPEGPRLIVVSLKAGGTGITLTAADTVIYYDPWWNPAVMDQAADRAHRIGQTKTVHLIKLVCQNSIEEQILALCEQKRAIANDVLLADTSGERSLTLEDIRQLLQVEIDREL